MFHVLKHGQCIAQYIIGFRSIDVGYESDTTGIVLELRCVQAAAGCFFHYYSVSFSCYVGVKFWLLAAKLISEFTKRAESNFGEVRPGQNFSNIFRNETKSVRNYKTSTIATNEILKISN
jgi:hypothetical protein